MIGGGLFYIPPGGADDPFQDFTNIDLARGLPPFLHQLQQGLRARDVHFQQDESLRVRTWYVHHQDAPRCLRSRIVELEGDPRHWQRDIQSAWRDHILPEEVVPIHVVHPEPLRWQDPSLHADLILSQGTGDNKAGLLSIYPGHDHAGQELATSLPSPLSGNDILAAGQVEHRLQGAICHINHGWQFINVNNVRDHAMQDGHYFTLTFVPLQILEPTEAENNTDVMSLMAHVPQLPQAEQPLLERQDAVQQNFDIDENGNMEDGSTDESEFSPQSSEFELGWHSVAVFDTHANSARGRVPFQPYEAFFQRTRALIGFRHHDVAHIRQIKPTPDDLHQISILPLLILRHDDDFENGDNRRAALVDVEHHGSTYESPVETDRFVIKLPNSIHRSNFLIWIKVDRYCAQMRQRCLVWHKGQLVPQQSATLMHIDHGDYIRVALPPFKYTEVPTQLASHCAHAGFSPAQTLHRFRDRGDDSSSIFSYLSARQPHPDDAVSTMQIAHSLEETESTCRIHSDAGTPVLEQQHPFFYPTRHQDRDREDAGPRPSWLTHMHNAFAEGACVEYEDEGPAGYFETWFIQGHHRYVTEVSRTLRVTQEIHWWYEDLLQLWEDKIDHHRPVHIYWVVPTPIALYTRERLGHLILTQETHEHLVPAQVTIEFHDDRDYRFALAAGLLPNPVAMQDVKDIANLARHCLVRRCTLRSGTLLWRSNEARRVQSGTGLTFALHPPITGAHFANEHLVVSQLSQFGQPTEADELENIPATPLLADQTGFVQQLFDIWDQQAIFGPAQLERLLRIETWFLDGLHLPLHDEHRNVFLAEDFWVWEEAIIHRWRDHINNELDINFVLVTPTPSVAAHPTEIHVIVYQRVPEFDHPSIVTIEDNGVLQGEQYPTAVVLPSAITKLELIKRVGRSQACPPILATAMCTCWHKHMKLGMLHSPTAMGTLSICVYTDKCIKTFGMMKTLIPKLLPQPIFFRFIEHPAYEWTTSWWDFCTPGQQIWIYYDGSAKRSQAVETSVTAAVAAFIQVQGHWQFAGSNATPLPFAVNSYEAEHYASAIGLKLAYDLLKIHEAVSAPMPELHFCFDSLTVGHQTAGLWHCFCHPVLGTVLRNIHRLIESRFHANIWHWHVRGHSGHPGNELADFLAGHAHGSDATSTTHWLTTITKPQFGRASGWFWILFDQQYTGMWDQHQIRFPAPTTMPEADLLHFPPPADPSEAERYSVDLHLRLATCNVLSLCGKQDDQECGISGPARQDALLRQFAEERVVIFGIQETRLRKLHHTHSEDYFLFKSAANERGQFGVIAGFAKHLPYAHRSPTSCSSKSTISYMLKEDDFSVIHQDPRSLIVRVSAQALRCIVVVGHAPHSGQEAPIIEQWWHSLHQRVPRIYANWPLLLLADANASVGHHPTDRIGETWMHTSGRTRRIDYIGLPHTWTPTSCSTWISDIIDPSLTRTDHLAVCADIQFQGEHYHTNKRSRPRKAKIKHAKDLDLSHLDGLPFVDFTVNVHTHADLLERGLADALSAHEAPPQPTPRKQTITPPTWEIVLQKRAARRHLAQLNALQRRDQLEFLFTAWKSRQSLEDSSVYDFNKLTMMQDMLIAKAVADFRALGRQATQALRRDDVNFYHHLLCEGADLLEPADVKRFWTVIRRSLPKFRDRKTQLPPQRLEVLEDQMLPHLCDLELGTSITPQQLIEQCHHRQVEIMRSLADSATSISATSLPTLTQFETSLRATASGKATGIDPIPSCVHHDQAPIIAKYYYDLILKMHLWCAEPVQFKGGEMCMIPKKGNPNEARNYRGILLLGTIAKRAHSMMRSALMTTLSPNRIEGQLGGFAHQMVHFGFHAVTIWTRILEQKGYSTAVLYLDLASAFHHLIREQVLGIARDDDFESILQALHLAGHPAEAREQGQRLIGALEAFGCDKRVVQLLQDVHTDTWFTLTSEEIIRTRRGTRPGSPLADAVFHTIMTHIMGEVRQWIHNQSDFLELLGKFDIPPLTIVWADDVAIPRAVEDAHQLLPALTQLVSKIDEQFASCGFTINYDLHKTNAVVTFQGRGAPALRKEYLLTATPGCECVLNADKTIWLHMRSTYKHLGFTFASSQTLDAEIRQRVGQARQALATLGRAVLWNRHYPVHLRLRLFRALVETKLFYGLGTWRTPSLRQMRQLRTAHIKMLSKVPRLPADRRCSNAQVLQMAGTVDVRILLAFERLRYARKVFFVGPAFLQHLAHQEYGHTKDSWMHGLAADLLWLNTLIPSCVPFDAEYDFTAVIEFWQQPSTPWKRILKRAWRLCLAQEHMMADITDLHQQFFSILKEGGAEFNPEPHGTPGDGRAETHHCHCGRTFDSPQGLALHRVRAHQEYSPEHRFISGASCPHCLRFFWTSARLQQHLAYIPRGGGVNRCFDALTRAGYITDYQAEQAPRPLQGALRMDALQASGPLRQSVDARVSEISQLEDELKQLEDELLVKLQPDDHLKAGEDLADRLTQCTKLWIDNHRGGCADSQSTDLSDWWLKLLLTYDSQFDEWTELVFISWGDHILQDIISEIWDGDLEQIVDKAYADLYAILPRAECLTRRTQLMQKIHLILEDCRAEPQPHRPRRFGTANVRERNHTIQQIPSLYATQADWLETLRQVRWRTLPPEQSVPYFNVVRDRPHFLVVHLFSGRRRPNDLHHHLNAWAARRGVGITVLSLDTANSPSYGNLSYRSATWTELVRCYDQGLVTATMAGSPCETFSEARHHQTDDGEAASELPQRPLPRPLRSFARLLGLEGLRLRELYQLRAGSGFFLQVTLLMAYQLTRGGYFVSEHPAPPSRPERASIWTSPWLALLRSHPDINLHVIPQWQFGATVPKPTGLLAMRLPKFLHSLYKKADPSLRKPTAVAIGRNDRAQRKICLRDHFLYEVYHRLCGQYLHYIRLPEGSKTSIPECLNQLGVQVHLTVDGLAKALKMLWANQCANIEVFADVYREISEISSKHSICPEQQEMLRGLVFVAGGIRTLEECTWEEEPSIQWLTQVPSLKVSYHRYGPRLQRYFLEVLQMPEVHPGFRPKCLLTALKNLVEHVEKAMSRNRLESLPGAPTTAGQLLDSMKDLAAQIYSALAQACRKSSMTWHADVRRAFVQERLLLLPGQNSPSNPSNPSNSNSRTSRTSSSQRAKRPKRLFAKEAWWDVEDELAQSKAANLSLRPLYEGVLGVPDAEFLFLRVLGIRKRCSRADIAHRLKSSMNCPGPLSNWAEGIDITDLEELEDIQTSSYFRPPDWRAPDRTQETESQETQDNARVNEAREARVPAAFQPPPAASPYPPAWRSTASASDAARRAEAALEAQRDQRRSKAEQICHTNVNGTNGTNRSNLSTRCQNPERRADVADAPVQQMQQVQRMQNVEHRAVQRADPMTESRCNNTEKCQHSSASAPNSSPARTPRHRFAWREAHQEHAERPQKVTWAQLRAQQEQKRHVSVLRESLQAPLQPTRASRASAWASFVGGEASQATERGTTEGAEGIQPDQTDAEALLARLEALQQTARQRRGQVEALCSERKHVEDTTERYVRILQDFYDNM
eukprot:s421_g16.t1